MEVQSRPWRACSPARSGRPPVSARGARTREALVKAAREVFERDGFLDARITDIAAAAGVATGSFYTYFTSKEDAFAAVIDELSDEEMLHPRLREPADRDDPVAMIEATNRSYLMAYRRNAKLMALMEQVAQVDEDFRRMRLRRVRAFTDRNAQAIAELQQRGLADPSLDPQLTAEALSAMVGRIAYYRYVHRFNSASIESLTQTLTALWAGALGLNARPAASPPAQAKEMTEMNFELSDRCQQLRERLLAFMDEHVYPAEPVYHEQLVDSGDPHFHPPVMEELKARAREQGLWNLFLPHDVDGFSSPGLTNVEYAPLAEIIGRSHIGPEACNCAAPDTGNMEVLTLFGTPEQQRPLAAPAARRRDPLGVRDDRARRWPARTRPTSRCGSSASATSTSSTAASGGPRAPCASAAGS